MNLSLSESDRSNMLRFYHEQHNETILKLNHIKSMLEKLESPIKGVQQIPFGEEPKPKTQKRKPRAKKRGRKSIWGEYILRTLKTLDRPISYQELISAAKVEFNIKDENIKSLKAAINQSAFRLRKIHKKIDTIGEKGRKEKFLVLPKWLDEGGELVHEYAAKIR